MESFSIIKFLSRQLPFIASFYTFSLLKKINKQDNLPKQDFGYILSISANKRHFS